MIVYLNGELLHKDRARVSVFDRGFVFGDGVYEGLRAVPRDAAGTRIVGLRGHEERMAAGLREAGIEWDVRELGPRSERLLAANDMRDAFVYWQVTRGTPGEGMPVRQRVPPSPQDMKPTVFAYCSPQPPIESFVVPVAKSAVMLRDIRWEMGRLKSISLMGNVWCAMRADAAGAEDAILVRGGGGGEEGLVGEGLATNVVIVTREGEVCTPSLESVPILAGVTRTILLRECPPPEINERAVRASELRDAREVMLIGTTTMVASVTRLDGRSVGEGVPGPVARSLLSVLVKAIGEGRDE